MTKVSAMPSATTLSQRPVQPARASNAGPSAPATPTTTTPATGAAKAARPQQPLDSAKIAKSASDFESMAIGQMLQPMFDTVDNSKSKFGGGPGEEAWKPLMVQEFAKQIEAHGGLGLAKPVYDAMLRMQQGPQK